MGFSEICPAPKNFLWEANSSALCGGCQYVNTRYCVPIAIVALRVDELSTSISCGNRPLQGCEKRRNFFSVCERVNERSDAFGKVSTARAACLCWDSTAGGRGGQLSNVGAVVEMERLLWRAVEKEGGMEELVTPIDVSDGVVEHVGLERC